jgi:dipeptidyl aminopeptidase/acylaminoacyl peptidase
MMKHKLSMEPLMKSIRTLIASLILYLPQAIFGQSFSLEQIMSSPFPSGLSAAPTGGKVAWIQNAQGMRNIWVAEPPEYRGRQLTQYTVDDGQDLSSLEWSPDAKTIIYVRGGSANRQGEFPNPTSNPAGAEQEIWKISIEGEQPIKIGQGSNPAISSKGDVLVFLRRGQIYWARLDTVKEPTQLIRARGNASSLRWSPDGSKLAFVSSRGEHSFIGVYDVAAKAVRFLEPSVDRDNNPVWSPDGRRIAFIRIPSTTKVGLFGPQRSGTPWSILVTDVLTGQGRIIWRAQEGAGSVFRGIVASNQLLWCAEDLLVFPWEFNGWTHLYAVPAQGGEAKLLTPGTFEVEYVTLTPDLREVVFNSNQDDIDRRHLWRVNPGDLVNGIDGVNVAGRRPMQVTKGKGIEWDPVVTSDGKAIAFFRSDARKPAHAAILVGFGGRHKESEPRELILSTPLIEIAPRSIPANFPLNSLVEPEQVDYTAADGMKIPAQLFLPPKARRGEKYPAVIFIHGGSRRQMLLGWHYLSYYHNAYALNQYLASMGYVVLSINFRSGTGYGMEFREALRYGAIGASEFNDVLGAGLYLKNRPDVDPEKIGLWGGSYGGYLTALGLARASDLFTAGVDIHGVHDWNAGIRTFVPNFNPLEDPERARIAFESSPMASVDSWRSPVLVIHGDDDRNVSFSETVALVEELRQRGVEVEQLVFPDEVHSFLLHSNWLKAFQAAADFLDRKLKGKRVSEGSE